jgi:peroxiredoxin
MKLALALAIAAAVAVPSVDDASVRAVDDLGDLVGDRPVAVIVVKATDCPVCAAQVASLARRVDDVRATGGDVVALLAADRADARAWAARTAGPFAVRTVSQPRILDDVGLWMRDARQPLPGVVFLDRCGDVRDVVRGRGPGASQDAVVLETLRRLARERTPCAGRA